MLNPIVISEEEIIALADAFKVLADAEGDFRPNWFNQEQVQITEEL